MKQSESGSQSGTTRRREGLSWNNLMRVPEQAPAGTHVALRDAQGVPFHLAYGDRLAEVYATICRHTAEYAFLPSVEQKVPPCLMRAAGESLKGCPSGLEAACFVQAGRVVCGRKPMHEVLRGMPPAPLPADNESPEEAP